MAIYIHIGLNKTGSTSIQQFCNENRILLDSLGLFYPTSGVWDSAHYGVSRMLIGRPNSNFLSDESDLTDSILDAISRKKDVLISSEYFFCAKKQEVEKIKDYFSRFDVDIKIIVYLRRHDLWVASLFNQAIKTTDGKHNWEIDIRDYFINLLGSKNFQISYKKILNLWTNYFGLENIIVRPFEINQFKCGEFEWDFFDLIDERLPDILQKKGLKLSYANESIPVSLISMISKIRHSSLDLDLKNTITSMILANKSKPVRSNSRCDNEVFNFSLDSRKSIVSFFEEDYQFIAKKYLKSKHGRLFKEDINKDIKLKNHQDGISK